MNPEKFRDDLTKSFLELLDSRRGVASDLAKSVGKTASLVNGVKRGNPVNALHLKAVGIVFGPDKVLELLSLGDIKPATNTLFKNQSRGNDITNRLAELEQISPTAFEMVATYITGAHEAAKATAAMWDGIERRNKEERRKAKEELGFERRKNGTEE